MILERSIKEIKGSVRLIKELADLYFKTFNERMKLGCGACYDKAYFRLTQKLNTVMNTKELKEKNFILKVDNIREFGSSKTYTNNDLTDAVAIAYLKQNINRLKQFSKYPDNLNDLINPLPKTNDKSFLPENVKSDEIKGVKKVSVKKRVRQTKSKK